MNLEKFDLQTLLDDHRLYHSEFQQDYFITTRSGGTRYGQYKQALREVYKRFRGLKGLYHEKKIAEFEMDEIKVDIDELTFNMKHGEYKAFELRRKQIELSKKQAEYDKKELDMVEMNKNIEDTEREFKRFYQQCVTLKNEIGELTEERRNQLDREMWIHNLKRICAVDLISSNHLKNTTVELMNSIPVKDRNEIFSAMTVQKKDKDGKLHNVRDPRALIAWYENLDEEFEVKELECDIKKLME